MHHILWEHAREGDAFEGDQRSFGEGGLVPQGGIIVVDRRG